MSVARSLCLYCALIVLVITRMILASGEDASEEQLRFLVAVFNQGLSSPLHSFPNDLYKEGFWPQGFGQLTKEGMRKQYEAGKLFRTRYNAFLNESYRHKEIYVQSFDSDSSLMSAYTFLNGLYPPTSLDLPLQPVPVHTVPRDRDPLLLSCPGLDEIWNDTFWSKDVQQFISRYENFRLEMERFTGANLSSIFNLDYIWDALTTQKANGLNVPGWYVNLTQVYSKEVLPFQLKSFYRSPRARRLASGRIVGELVKFFRLKEHAILDQQLKAYLLFADAAMMRSLLSGLNIDNYQTIPFSSSIMVELRHSDASGYTVEIWLQNRADAPLRLTILGCLASCPIKQFLNLTSDIVSDNWYAECHQSSNFAFLKLTQLIALVFGCTTGLVALLICCVTLCCRCRCSRKPVVAPKKYSKMRTVRSNSFPEEMPMMHSLTGSDQED